MRREKGKAFRVGGFSVPGSAQRGSAAEDVAQRHRLEICLSSSESVDEGRKQAGRQARALSVACGGSKGKAGVREVFLCPGVGRRDPFGLWVGCESCGIPPPR